MNDLLSKKYGELTNNLVDNLMNITEKVINQNYDVLLENLGYETNDSFLEDLDELNIDSIFNQTLIASTQYVVLSRCGIDPNLYIDDENFKHIAEFNTQKVISQLGDSIQSVSKEILVDVGKICTHIDKNIEQFQQKQVKPIVIENDIQYNNSSDKFNTLKHETTNENMEEKENE